MFVLDQYYLTNYLDNKFIHNKHMTDEKSLEDRIRDDLIKSGFPLELEISNLLEENNWNFFPNEYIVDQETDVQYEMDIRAVNSQFSKTNDEKFEMRSFLHLIIECKKCEKHPWVFFIRERQEFENTSNLIRHAHNFGINKPYRIESQNSVSDQVFFSKNIDYSRLNLFSGNEKSTSYCQAFRKPSMENQIYFAVRSVLRSFEFLSGRQKESLSKGRWTQLSLHTYIPVIVVDDNLFEARMSNGKLEIQESSHIPLIFNIHNNHEKYLDQIMINVVKLDYFNQFLHEAYEDMEYLHDEFIKLQYISPK